MSTVIKENCDQLFLRPDIYSTTAKAPSAGLIYGSGICPLDGQGKIVPGGIKEHTAHVIKSIEKALKNAGSDLNHLVKMNIYLKDMDDFVEMNKVYDELIPAPKPARTCIQAGKLPGDVVVEMEYVAAMPSN